jgi:hypothetical protein
LSIRNCNRIVRKCIDEVTPLFESIFKGADRDEKEEMKGGIRDDLGRRVLSTVMAACAISEVIQITKSHCPVHVVTRWFSRENSIA